jgi:hypothetical protein
VRAVIGEKMEAGFPPSRALGFGNGLPHHAAAPVQTIRSGTAALFPYWG